MMPNEKKDNRITKEIALALTPFAMAFLFVAFYEAGSAIFYGIPLNFINISVTDVILANRMTLIIVAIAFLWIGLYYNILPSAHSPVFQGIITIILIGALWLGFNIGKWNAGSRTDYLTVKAEPEYVVLKIYGDNVITAPFNRRDKTFEQSFRISKAGTEANVTYRLENVGPLVPRQ